MKVKPQTTLTAVAGASTFLFMLGYESVKEFIFAGSLTPWQSQWITIFFTTAVSIVISLLVINRILIFKEKELHIRL